MRKYGVFLAKPELRLITMMHYIYRKCVICKTCIIIIFYSAKSFSKIFFRENPNTPLTCVILLYLFYTQVQNITHLQNQPWGFLFTCMCQIIDKNRYFPMLYNSRPSRLITRCHLTYFLNYILDKSSGVEIPIRLRSLVVDHAQIIGIHAAPFLDIFF